VFRKRLLFFFISILGVGYAFAAGSNDFPEASVAAFDAESGVAHIAIDWKKVRTDDERQFGLYRSAGESADVYTLITTLNTSITVFTDSGLNVDTEYHYLIGGALPRRELPQIKERGKKERRAELSSPRAAISYGNLPAGPIAWIPPVKQPDAAPASQPDGYPSPAGAYQPPPQSGGYPSAPSQAGGYQPSPSQLGVYQSAPFQAGTFQSGGGYQVAPETANAPPMFPYHEPVGNFTEPVFSNGGVFFSMGFFSNRVFELTEAATKPALVSLIDNNAKTQLLSVFRQNYVRSALPGTSLYYAIHHALNRMSAWDVNGAMTDFDTVLLVTITDGIDTASTDPTLAPIEGRSFSEPSTYQNFIKTAIESRRISGKKITAVSIGLRGTDTVTEREYTTTLRSAATAEENVYRIPLNNLTKTLQNIATSVTDSITVQPLGFVTPVYPNGTDIFIALDGFSTPPRGQHFIAGRIKVSGSQVSLENITLGGLAKGMNPTLKNSIAGRLDPNGSVEWLFNFSEAVNPAKVVLYYKTGKDWRNSKELAIRTYVAPGSRHSALVYLLIDNSGSMSNQNIAAIRESVTHFIETLSANPAGLQPAFSSNAALAMSRLPERPTEPKLAAAEPLQPQWERPSFPNSRETDARPPASVTLATPPAASLQFIPQPISGTKGYWVQTSSSESKTIAEQIIAQLREYQLSPVITEAQVRGKTFYRVRIGPYASIADASVIADFVKKPPLGFYDSFIP
jgi:cell division septation protein DedD